MATDYRQLVENKRQAMVNALLESIEKNPTKWERGWYALDVPYNATTGKNYNGLNSLFLFWTLFRCCRWRHPFQCGFLYWHGFLKQQLHPPDGDILPQRASMGKGRADL